VPAESRVMAYQDEPIHIGHGQTVSQPYMTALMAESLELTGAETVLEVGAGSGYAAAVLGAVAARVVTVEIIPALAQLALENLRRTSRDANVTVVCGDGSLGYPEGAPFDGISVAAGAPEIPAALLDQLKDPGRLVIPWAISATRSCAWSRNCIGASITGWRCCAGSFRCAAERGGNRCGCARRETGSKWSTASSTGCAEFWRICWRRTRPSAP